MSLSFTKHEHYIKHCFFLAKKGIGTVSPNPPVGAVLVYRDKIIGSGYHHSFGDKHAEVEAIESVNETDRSLIRDSSLYISLEPCSHHGKTPACTDLILRQGIKQVYFSCADPNPIMSGKSAALLNSFGINTTWPVLEKEGKELIKTFTTNVQKSRPYIILKFAQSADFFMGHKGERTKISNVFADQWVHKWRTEADGILIGRATLEVDNPRLTSRLWPGKNPTRILLADLPIASRSAYHFFNEEGNSICLSDLGFKESFELDQFVPKLLEKGIGILLVEGGANTIQRFYECGLWDEARIITNKLLYLGHGIPAPSIIGQLIFQQDLLDNSLQIIKKQEV